MSSALKTEEMHVEEARAALLAAAETHVVLMAGRMLCLRQR